MKLRMKTSTYLYLLWCCMIVSLVFFTSSAIVHADELEGKVIQVSGKIVEIKLDSNLIPQKGDKVSISFDVPGVGPVPLKGKWQVTKVGQGSITAGPSGDTAQPKKGQKATIQCENPQSREVLQGEAKVFYEQAEDYYNGRNGVEKDYEQAVGFYRQAAELGDAEGEYSLGYMYAKGQGVIQNEATAKEWYLKAAKQGYSPAQYSLGRMYENGKGIPRDYAGALKWYRLSADQGHVKAQTNLGGMYFRGKGVAKDYDTALYWFRKAAEKGHPTAQSNMGVLYQNGNGVAKNKAVAIEWYRKAAKQGYSPAQKNLKKLGADW